MKKGISFRLAAGFIMFAFLDIILLVCLLFAVRISNRAFAMIMAASGVLSLAGAFILSKNYDADDNYDRYFLFADILLFCAFMKLFLTAVKTLR